MKSSTDHVVPLVEAGEGLLEVSPSAKASITPFECSGESPTIDNNALKTLVDIMAIQICLVEKRLKRLERHVGKSKGYPDVIIKQLASGISPIKVFRKHRGKTQRELAKTAGCSTAYISQLERRKRLGSMKMLGRIANFLDVDVHELIES